MDEQEKDKKDVVAEETATEEEPLPQNEDVTESAAPVDADGEKEADGKKQEAGESAGPGEDAASGEESSEDAENRSEPDWKAMYARTMADFDNFRKRTARDREELFKSAASDMLKDILPTVDNLALALEKATDKEDPFVKGVQLVYDGLIKMLADHGATPIDSLGEPLDTNFHDAIATLPSPEVPEGHVMTEVKRGWLLNGKVLRAAQVVVSAGKGE